MEKHVNIDLNEIVATIAGVMFTPYTSFIAQLHAEGRVTDEEMERLRQEFSDRVPRLGDLVAERLSQDHEAKSPPPPPDQE